MIQVEDSVAMAREAKERLTKLTTILNEGNASLIKTFGHLTSMVEKAAEDNDLETVHEGLELIDRLADIGVSSRSVDD
jgi:hypothetical protein